MSLPQNVKRWAFYSFANHSYQVVYLSFLLPVFFSTVLISHGYSLGVWGTVNGVSTVVGVIIAIIVGRYSDTHGKRQAFKWSIILSALGMLAISLSAKFLPASLVIVFLVANALFIWSLSLFDSILPHIADNKKVFEYGGFSWGFGYVGGIISLILALLLQHLTSDYSLIVFLSVPIFYILFSSYSLHGLREIELNSNMHSGVQENYLFEPSPKIKISKKQKGILFLGYWLISECITVIILFASIFLSQELHFSLMQIGIALLSIQLIGFPATWYGGRLVGRFSSLRLLGITVLLWGGGLTSLIFIHSGLLGLILAIICIGLAYGNSQSFLRSQYATLIERSESGFQFGMYSVISEAAVFIGPIIFGFASDRLHSQKIPLLFIYGCMVVGFFLVKKVISTSKVEIK